MNDRISIYDETGKLVVENELALVDGDNIITDRGNFIVEVGYSVKRELENGLIENYRVIQANYYSNSTGIINAHYQMKVTNVKASVPMNNSVVNNITVSDNARFYNDSVDNSSNTYNSYTLNQYEKALEAVNSQVSGLDLHQSEKDLIKHGLERIENELKKPSPNKDVLSTCISFLPTSVATLESVINLGQMLGIY